MAKIGHFDVSTDDKGKPIQTIISVFLSGTETLATIYIDEDGLIEKDNPFQSDSIGRFLFYASTGKYDVEVSGDGITTYKIPIALSEISKSTELTDMPQLLSAEDIGKPLIVKSDFSGYEVGDVIGGEENVIRPEEYGAVGDGATDDRAAFQAMFNAMAADPTLPRKVLLRPANYYSIKSALNATNVFEIAVTNLIMEGPGMYVIPTIKYEGAASLTNFFAFGPECYFSKISEIYILGHVTKIQNIVSFNDTNYTSWERCYLRAAAAGCMTGFNWMTELRHCVFQEAAFGVGNVATTAFVANCYVIGCAISYKIFSLYGTYISCASDYADIAYLLEEPWSIAMIGCGAEQCDQAIVGKALSLSVQGFTTETVAEPVADACFELTDTKGVIEGVYGKIYNTWWIKADDCQELRLGPTFPKDKIYDFSTADAYDRPQRPSLDKWGYYQKSYAAADFQVELQGDYSYFEGCQRSLAGFATGTPTFTTTTKLHDVKGTGYVQFQAENFGDVVLTFTQSNGNAIEIKNTHIPVIFRNLHFKQSGTGVLFKIENCALIKFINCKFETTNANGNIFDIDDYSLIEIDKATMDRTAGTWSNLDTGNPVKYRVKFLGYTTKPVAGVFRLGTRIEFDEFSAGGSFGCVCTEGGIPGTWKYFGTIEE